MPCFMCNGTGNQYLTPPGTPVGTFHDRERVDCPRCDGTGDDSNYGEEDDA